jgi:hypothetical protein
MSKGLVTKTTVRTSNSKTPVTVKKEKDITTPFLLERKVLDK